MKWNHEIEFDNIANFLGKLFNKTPEDIKERFENIPDMYVLAFKDDSDIKGVIVSIRNDKADNILETIYVAFEPDFNFKETNVFNKLNNFLPSKLLYGVKPSKYIHIIFVSSSWLKYSKKSEICKSTQLPTLTPLENLRLYLIAPYPIVLECKSPE